MLRSGMEIPRIERRKQALNPPDFRITKPRTLQNLLIGSRLREHLRDISAVMVDEVHELATNLGLLHGRTAVIALSARGVGPDTASRSIRKLRASEDEFYAGIFEAERNYVQTLRFRD